MEKGVGAPVIDQNQAAARVGQEEPNQERELEELSLTHSFLWGRVSVVERYFIPGQPCDVIENACLGLLPLFALGPRPESDEQP